MSDRKLKVWVRTDVEDELRRYGNIYAYADDRSGPAIPEPRIRATLILPGTKKRKVQTKSRNRAKRNRVAHHKEQS